MIGELHPVAGLDVHARKAPGCGTQSPRRLRPGAAVIVTVQPARCCACREAEGRPGFELNRNGAGAVLVDPWRRLPEQVHPRFAQREEIRVRQKDPTWWRPGEPAIPPKDPRNILGTRWLGFQETQDLAGFGIHGTDDPGTIGKESSAGCVRLRNQDIEVLYDFVSYGTEVVIQS